MSVKRRRTGATLGLVAVCVLVIIVLGIGFFFLSKIFGGEREVAGATDSGTLNVAKMALRSQQASTPVQSDFQVLDDSKFPGQTTLFTYNRCVAQTLLVLLNAYQENPTPGSMPQINAAKVLNQLKAEGTALQSELQNPGTFISSFSSLADGSNGAGNNTRMAGNNGVNQVQYQTALMQPGYSTNIYFNTASFPNPAFALGLNMFNQSNVNLVPTSPTANPDFYLAGYQPINIAGNTLIGVPVFPQTKPHLVSLNDFNGNVPNTVFTDPLGWTPPNAFKIASSSLDSKAQVFGGATACAIVGATQTAAQAADFLGALPGGYIAINNAAPANAVGLWGPSDGTNNIFNNELFNQPGIQTTMNSAGNEIFTTDTNAAGGQIAAWQAYNATYNANGVVGQPIPGSSPPANYDANKRNPNLYPPSLGYNINNMYTATSPGAYAASTIQDALLITSTGMNCLTYLNANGTLGSTPCQNYLTSYEGAYGRNMGNGPPLVGNQFTDMDVLKLDLINAFQGTGQFGSHTQSVTLSANLPPSGMGVLKPPGNGPSGNNIYAWTGTGNDSIPLEQTSPAGTVLQMLQQIGQNQAAVVTDITQRCNEVSPGTTPAQVNALLNTPLQMGQTLFIYLNNPRVQTSGLVCNTSIPVTVTGTGSSGLPTTQPDGTMVTGSITYDLVSGGYIDTASTNGSNGGDNNLHERPYRQVDGDNAGGGGFSYSGVGGANQLTATDTMQWTPSSGYQNMLGELKFFQTTAGSDAFSAPN